VQKQLDCFSAC